MGSEVTQNVIQNMNTNERELVEALLDLQEGQSAPKCVLNFHWETKDKTNILNIF